ncbi:hypothetical protein LOK49_LG03G00242 [Camellia lanceoleosa]|uniref:Uncharacterized protein n=1 Tax=Camellia lanceoleosa TaxID=1840588 RepID=A0ACC0I9U8_9ERIC|nr:hypothetical protein LOK49_LG03G00242 [Camellia lanceoleosa]
MVVVLGNLGLLLDVSLPRAVVLNRKPCSVPTDVVLSLFKKDTRHYITGMNSFESNKESRQVKEGEFKERRKTAQLMFKLGQMAYGKGMYGRAIEFLEGALIIIPRPTLFGGEIQIWLAMADEANNRHVDCIALYKQLENDEEILTTNKSIEDSFVWFFDYILFNPAQICFGNSYQ